MSNSDDGLVVCGCLVLVLMLNLILGGWSVNYLIVAMGGNALPHLVSIGIGAFTGEVTVPLAFFVVALRWAGLL